MYRTLPLGYSYEYEYQYEGSQILLKRVPRTSMLLLSFLFSIFLQQQRPTANC